MNNQLEATHFARLFGTTEANLPSSCMEIIAHSNFSYRTTTKEEHDQIVLGILKRLDEGRFSKAGKEGKQRWEKGWGENLQEFVQHNFNPEQLTPRYIHPGQPLRLERSYIFSESPDFELNYYRVFRDWLFKTYLDPFDNIFEFGSGSGHNLVTLAGMFPKKKIYGLDWAKPAVDIANHLGERYHGNISGIGFDFFEPDYQVKIPANSVVMTIGGLEQTSDQFEAFLTYLIHTRPAMILHIEPFLEWYDENNLIDYLAIRFHTFRRYLEGYLPRIQELVNSGQVEIVKAQRHLFGSLYHDGYSFLIWRFK